MKVSDRIAMSVGALDIAYVAWTTFAIARGALGLESPNLGAPFSEFEIVVNLCVYLVMAACGAALVQRCHSLSWLNYLLLPVRILLVIPTLYPVFALLTALGVVISIRHELVLLLLSEFVRCIFVFLWDRKWRERLNATKGARGI